jgi:transcriptional regulator GlxA family with amidase domain
MAAHCTEVFHLGAIARAVDVGPRSLQLAFRRHRRRSPLQFLQDCRLHLVRRRLSDGRPGTSVTSTAVDCGFSHLGRFSETYRRAFGERPSQTLRRARLEPT